MFQNTPIQCLKGARHAHAAHASWHAEDQTLQLKTGKSEELKLKVSIGKDKLCFGLCKFCAS